MITKLLSTYLNPNGKVICCSLIDFWFEIRRHGLFGEYFYLQNFTFENVFIYLKMDIDDIDLNKMKLVESGEYGNILKYNDKICIKIIKDKYSSVNYLFEKIYTNLLKIIDFDHPNLIQLYDVFFKNKGEIGEKFIIKMEYFESSDLVSVGFNSKFKWENVKFLLKSIINALLYLKEHNLIHRDIKSENILVNNINIHQWNRGTIFKLCDYDYVVNVDKKFNEFDLTKFGTLGFSPPEFWFSKENQCRSIKNLDFSIDIWSIGMLIIDMMICNEDISKIYEKNSEYINFINDFTEFNFISSYSKKIFNNNKHIHRKHMFQNYKQIVQNHPNYEKIDKVLLFNLLTEPEKRWSLEKIYIYLNK